MGKAQKIYAAFTPHQQYVLKVITALVKSSFFEITIAEWR